MENEKEMFMAFEEVRESGICNMFDRKTVCEVSGLSKEEYSFVIKNYDELCDKYLEED